MAFQIIEKQSASTACANALRKAILSGDLHAGQRLPPERTLSEQFGVNRLTLRSALAQIVALGLVTVRQGSGYTVADLKRVGGTDLLPDVLEMARENRELWLLVEDLLDVRRALAGSLLDKVSRVATPAALQDISTAIDHFDLLTENEQTSVSEFVEADFSIVAAMIDAAQSPIMRLCLNPVIAAVAQIKELGASMYIDPSDNLVGHRLLFQWLKTPSMAPLSSVLDALKARDVQTLYRLKTLAEESK